MQFVTRLSIWLTFFLFSQAAFSQLNRIPYNNQQLFLSGSNLAWVSFANDIGTGNPDTTGFTDVLTAMNSSGGNAMRWWLHTNGTVSPEFDPISNYVISPGANTISDIRKVLDIAWQREIGVILCLWSFDMLRLSNSPNVLARNDSLLVDTNYTRAYINNCLIPMVDSLKGHPAIIAWEIFNEPEGMSNEFGWGDIGHVSMATISRFVNLCAAAIHRTDTTAQVTSGAVSFYSLVDAPILAKIVASAQTLTYAEKIQDAKVLIQKNRLSTTPEEMVSRLQKIAYPNQRNYYSDSMLIAQGGDSAGVLDFYSVHFYGSGTSTSPFHNLSSYWNLTKPIVVAEFAMESGQGAPTGIAIADIYTRLYNYGYAGALAWSWSDQQISSHAHVLAGMLSMWNSHQSDVNVNGISGAWPAIAITSPASNANFLDTTAIPITAGGTDIDGYIDSVEFYIADTIKIGAAPNPPFSMTWQNVTSGNYDLTAVATDNNGHIRTSTKVPITVGLPSMVRYEAENVPRSGPGMTLVTDATASGGRYVNIATSDTAAKITWTVNNVLEAGDYTIGFGFKLNADIPKVQYINVNGVRGELLFTGATQTEWYQRDTVVSLVQGSNTIQMQMSWGWMAVDYLAVPRSVVTSVENPLSMPVNFSLAQNYPNPFNPTTNIKYSLMHSGLVKLVVYDILGRQVKTLINERQNAGTYDVPFNASALTSGVYFYRITAGSFSQTRKMVVLK